MPRIYTVGRNSNADIQVPPHHDEVSKRHLQIEMIGNNRAIIKDLGSSNGTSFWNGFGWENFTSEREISMDCKIKLGEYVTTPRALLNLVEIPHKSPQKEESRRTADFADFPANRQPIMHAAILARSSSFFEIIKLLLLNPTVEIRSAFDNLGNNRALGLALGFGGVFSLACAVNFSRPFSKFGDSVSVDIFMFLLAIAFVPFCCLSMSCALARLVFGGPGSISGDAYVSGMAITPFSCASILSIPLGIGNFEVVLILQVFALCLAMLILFFGLNRVSGINERSALFCVPLTLIGSLWLAKIIYVSYMERFLSEYTGFLPKF
jgi:hypothetical protein